MARAVGVVLAMTVTGCAPSAPAPVSAAPRLANYAETIRALTAPCDEHLEPLVQKAYQILANGFVDVTADREKLGPHVAACAVQLAERGRIAEASSLLFRAVPYSRGLPAVGEAQQRLAAITVGGLDARADGARQRGDLTAELLDRSISLDLLRDRDETARRIGDLVRELEQRERFRAIVSVSFEKGAQPAGLADPVAAVRQGVVQRLVDVVAADGGGDGGSEGVRLDVRFSRRSEKGMGCTIARIGVSSKVTLLSGEVLTDVVGYDSAPRSGACIAAAEIDKAMTEHMVAQASRLALMAYDRYRARLLARAHEAVKAGRVEEAVRPFVLHHLHSDGVPNRYASALIEVEVALLASRSLDGPVMNRLGGHGYLRPVPSLEERRRPKVAR